MQCLAVVSLVNRARTRGAPTARRVGPVRVRVRGFFLFK